jgi:CIC family chloride channel protein
MQNIFIKKILRKIVTRYQVSETSVLAVAAIIVGFFSGLGVWLFKYIIELSHTFFFEDVGGLLKTCGNWTIILIPVTGGIIVGLLMHYFVGEEKHHGVTGIIESVALGGGRLRYWRIPVKSISSALSIGSGASVGPEDPSVQIGANLGSMFGQVMRMSEERVRTLVSAGAAAGIAAAFNAPIAGVFFTMEIIRGEIAATALGVVVLSSVTSAVITQVLSGPQPAFIVPAYNFNSPWELGLYFVLGLLAGPISALYIQLVYFAQDLFHSLHIPRPVRTATAGLLVGVVGFFLPQIFGVGYETIGNVLQTTPFPFLTLILLLTAKMVMTSTSIGGEFPGGVFAPSLFIGAMLGSAVGLAGNMLFPGLHIVPAAFAMVGMAAVLAGTVHAPLTAILLLFEMTHDYHIILPLMFSVIISLLISNRLHRDSIYTLGLARKGLRIESGRDVEVLEGITVGEVMDKNFVLLKEDETLHEAAEKMLRLRSHGLMVVDAGGNLSGILTLQDIQKVEETGNLENVKVGEVCSRQVITAFPNETLATALRRMSMRDIGRLPVVSQEDARKILGVLRRSDTIRAYDMAVTKRTALRHRAQQARLGVVTGARVEEITVQQDAPCVGKRLSEVNWPRDSVIASIRRRSKLMIPHGDTILQSNDVLTIVYEGNADESIRNLCRTQKVNDAA